MKIVIRADASIHIGNGHIMRCLVLANALKDQGHQIYFACRPQQGDLIDFVRNKGFVVKELVTPKKWLTPKNSADYIAWLQVPWQDDAQSLFEQFPHTYLVIVDHYGLNHQWQEQVQSNYACKIVAIDDLVRCHHADIIIDQTLLRNKHEYAPKNPNSIILAGCDYALINPLFAQYRKQLLTKTKTLSKPVNILVTMGGIDSPNATLKVLNALAVYNKQSAINVTVLLSPKAPHYKEVQHFSFEHKYWITHINFVENMAELMSKQDIAIGAPGSTSWERACLGLPSILIPLADNQHDICHKLVKIGAALTIKITEIEAQLPHSINQLIDKWAILREVNFSLCDANGVLRVVQCINTQLITKKSTIKLRKASTTDITQVYNWQCMPETRKYALTANIPSWETHQQWMHKKLMSNDDHFYIIESVHPKVSIGVLRLDKLTENKYVISIFIDAKYFGQGFATQALTCVDRMHCSIIIQATVLSGNIASHRLFTAANYQQITADTYIRSPIIEKQR